MPAEPEQGINEASIGRCERPYSGVRDLRDDAIVGRGRAGRGFKSCLPDSYGQLARPRNRPAHRYAGLQIGCEAISSWMQAKRPRRRQDYSSSTAARPCSRLGALVKVRAAIAT